MSPQLYGVGLGPGAADLVTPRAIAVLRSVDVIVAPKASAFGRSVAMGIVKAAVGPVEGQERIAVVTPMSRDPEQVRAAWEPIVATVLDRLALGKRVAFAVEGDPMLYSSFLYLRRAMKVHRPELAIAIVPGITSVTAVAAAADTPLGDGQECIAILPATYTADELSSTFARFDTTVLMKIGSNMPAVVEALAAQRLIDKAVFVSRATQPEQRVVRDVRDAVDAYGDCFSMVIVARGERAGLLVGEVPESPQGTFENEVSDVDR